MRTHQNFKRPLLLLRPVSTVVDDNVDSRMLGDQGPKQRYVRLTAMEEGRPRNHGSQIKDPHISIKTDDGSVGPEVISPHLQRPAVLDSDLEHHGILSTEAFEPSMIDV